MLKPIRVFVPVLTLLLATVAIGSAQEAISNVRVLDAGGSPVTAKDGSYALPEGAKKATVQFAYDLGGAESVGVTVYALGAPSVVLNKSLSGKGTADFEITGDAIYRTVSGEALKGAQAAVAAHTTATAALAGTGTHASSMSYLETITTAWSSLDSTQAMLQRLKLDSAFEKSVSNLDKAIDDFDTAVTAMKAAGTEDAKKAKMGDLKAPLLAAQAAVTDLNDRVGKANGLALPTTGSDSKTPIDVAIKRDGSTAESLQILVGTGSLVPAATNTKSSQSLTGDKTATPAPSGAQTQGQPTAASGGQSSGTTGQSGASQSGGTTAGAAANPAVPGSGMSGAGALASGSTPAPGQAENPANPADPASMASNAGAAADSQSVNTSNSAQAVATWTPGPDGSQAVAQLADDPAASPISTSSGGGGGGSGPNIAIIAVGALVLVGAALWLRRRM